MVTFTQHTAVDLPDERLATAIGHFTKWTWAGAAYLWWKDRAAQIDPELVDAIDGTAKHLRAQSDVIVVVGIWWSYLWAKAVLDAWAAYFQLSAPRIIFAGHHMDAVYYAELLAYLDTVNYSLIIISKSGTTLEPKLASDTLLAHCAKKYGAPHAQRVVMITDAHKGVLREIATQQGYTTYVVPDDVGGRYSVATPVGLLPLACAGVHIRLFLSGMIDQTPISCSEEYARNVSAQYAWWRYMQLMQGKRIECLVSFKPRFGAVGGRRQQLFGESEGKEGKWLYPDTLAYSTDLHSLGQYLQDGPRDLIETMIVIDEYRDDLFSRSNKGCMQGTLEAHLAWWVPVSTRTLPDYGPYALGAWMYAMMASCAISAYLLEVNPFDQPGVEAYKQAMKKYVK